MTQQFFHSLKAKHLVYISCCFYVTTFCLEVDRIRREGNSTLNQARVYFTARLNHRLQDPHVVVPLLSLLLPMELAIKMGHRVCGEATPASASLFSSNLCWLRSCKFPMLCFSVGLNGRFSRPVSKFIGLKVKILRTKGLEIKISSLNENN